MVQKIFGATFVIIACGSVGFQMAANHRKEESALRQLIRILGYMECELQFRLTPLPLLCRQVAKEFGHAMGTIFCELAQEIESQNLPDISVCMKFVLEKHRQLPQITRSCLELLGNVIGRFDLEGQKKELLVVKRECQRQLELLASNRESRLRNYQTLSLCAGAALAILFV